MTIEATGYEMVRKIAGHEVERLHLLEYGIVESVDIHESEDDKIGYTCSVVLPARGDIKIEKVPISVGFTGVIDVPYVDDMVLISYINGDFELPVIMGKLYSKEKKPPLFKEGQHLIELSKDPAKTSEPLTFDIQFVDGSQTTLNLTDSTMTVTIGSVKMLLSAGDEGTKIELEAGGTKISMEEDGDISLETPTCLNIKADSDINFEASGNVVIKGAKVDIN